MTTIQLSVQICAPPESVYDYVTRPACWKEWHFSSLGATDNAKASLVTGDTFEEDIRSAGFKRHLRWQVLEHQPAARWKASAVMDDGSTVLLHYEFQPHGSGTAFQRTLTYEIKPWLLRTANRWLMWRKVRMESRRALANLAAHFATVVAG